MTESKQAKKLLSMKDQIEEKTKANVIISADPCYGACDQPLVSGQLDIDLIVQFGHAKIPNLESPVASIRHMLKSGMSESSEKRACLAISKWENGEVDSEPILISAVLHKSVGDDEVYLGLIFSDENKG